MSNKKVFSNIWEIRRSDQPASLHRPISIWSSQHQYIREENQESLDAGEWHTIAPGKTFFNQKVWPGFLLFFFFFFFSPQTYLSDPLLMSTHKICFRREIRRLYLCMMLLSGAMTKIQRSKALVSLWGCHIDLALRYSYMSRRYRFALQGFLYSIQIHLCNLYRFYCYSRSTF